jgi:hypothetical protein
LLKTSEATFSFKAPRCTEKKLRCCANYLSFHYSLQTIRKNIYLKRLLYQNIVILKSNAFPNHKHKRCKIYVAIIFTSFFYGSVNICIRLHRLILPSFILLSSNVTCTTTPERRMKFTRSDSGQFLRISFNYT